ncbi:transposase [Thiorhodococcus minor]|uniref:Uncharacterized protein n=1 Tax=Thiorhodococcus minor TaxID=57489 RepID=A0A6M0JSE5_9GAMM|nr:transposase [Thiorhodococcus minor]NEV60440.1 hypothetical protein [Thiorhodococcus minor]
MRNQAVMRAREGDPSMTECHEAQLEFHGLGRREVIGQSNGGAISSDGGGLLLVEVEAHTGSIARLAEQFVDHRNPDLIELRVKSHCKRTRNDYTTG